MMETQKPARRFHYAWVIFGICFLMVCVALGFCSSTSGLYLSAITADLQIPRSLYAIGNSFRYLATALVNLFFGKLVLRFGPRKLSALGFGCLALSCLVNACARGIAGFYLGGVLLGVGLAWTTTTMVAYVVERWFTSRKGTIMGFILAANGIGGAVSIPLLTPVIYGTSDGWRSSYLMVAGLLLVVGILVFLLLRNQPQDKGLSPLGSGQTVHKQRGREWNGISTETAVRRPYFYLCLVYVFLTGMMLQSISSVASAHMLDRGLSPELSASILSVYSLCITGSKMWAGFSFDRFGLRTTVMFCGLCAVAGFLLLAFISNGVTAMIAMIFFALSLPLETIMLPLITSELFGRHSYAAIMGLVVSCNTLGYAAGAPLMNLIFDKTGTYSWIMVWMAGLMAVLSVQIQFVISAAHREQRAVEAKN